jgi:hypothetical protein
MSHLAYDHINDSFFRYSYTKTETISLMQGYPDQYPETQNVKSSHSCVAAHSSLVIKVFSKQFSSDISALNPMPWTSSSSYNTHTRLSNKSNCSIKDLATLPIANGLEARVKSQNGAVVNSEVVYALSLTFAPTTLPAL